ncbi:MAG TPA: FMN-binding protein [Subdoligranulum variabile]|uniref:FMN-binding protein n=1 Tax=Subdoligranulum variabile TaxID=214851 RepID=A0A921LPI1_9FIRM|nr:FMN-binding protein [Subdoligranulum variabile]
MDGIASATYSSNAVFSAVNAAIDCYTNQIKGGE